jgi:hypothetical protein
MIRMKAVKNTPLLVLVFVLAFSLVGCDRTSFMDVFSSDPPATTTENEEPDMSERIDITEKDEPFAMSEQEKAEMLRVENVENGALEKDSRRPYDKLISARYPEQGFFDSNVVGRFYNPVMGFQISLCMVQDEYGYTVECLRRISDTSAYCIFKTDEGGLVYCFFRKEYSSWDLHNASYVKNALTKDAFAGIGVGSSFRDVSSVDNLVDVYEAYATKWQMKEFCSVHLLKDCLVVIDFSSSDSQYFVKGIRYFNDFKFVLDELNGIVYDYTILPEDYLH